MRSIPAIQHTAWRVALVLLFAAILARADEPAPSFASLRPNVQNFIARMSSQHGFASDALGTLLAQAQSQQTILDAMARPAERTLLWYEYRARFLTEQRITQGIEFWEEHRELLDQTAKEHGVPPEYLVAILGVETSYGRITGRYRVIDALSTLAFDYPPRASYFTNELEQFLLLAREESIDALAPLGSYAGAMGPPQFMPGSIRRFGIDADGDGKRDLWNDWPDIVGSVANYLRMSGWRPGEPVLADAEIDQAHAHDLDSRGLDLDETVGSLHEKGVRFETSLPADAPAMLIAADQADGIQFRVGLQNFFVITRYNRSALYAMAVHDLASTLLVRVMSADAPG